LSLFQHIFAFEILENSIKFFFRLHNNINEEFFRMKNSDPDVRKWNVNNQTFSKERQGISPVRPKVPRFSNPIDLPN
jgi:hypothetical protein